MLASQQVYEDTQHQALAPIGPQEPIPAGVHDIELSWDRKRGYMRVILNNQTWHFKEFLGKAQVTGTDNKRGRIYLRAMARIDGETLTVYRDPSAPYHSEVDGDSQKITSEMVFLSGTWLTVLPTFTTTATPLSTRTM